MAWSRAMMTGAQGAPGCRPRHAGTGSRFLLHLPRIPDPGAGSRLAKSIARMPAQRK